MSDDATTAAGRVESFLDARDRGSAHDDAIYTIVGLDATTELSQSDLRTLIRAAAIRFEARATERDAVREVAEAMEAESRNWRNPTYRSVLTEYAAQLRAITESGQSDGG